MLEFAAGSIKTYLVKVYQMNGLSQEESSRYVVGAAAGIEWEPKINLV